MSRFPIPTPKPDSRPKRRPRPLHVLLALVLTLVACRRGPAPTTAEIEPPDPDRVARGAYLVHHVVLCETCHSERDWGYYSGPPVPGSERRGGTVDLFGSTDRAPEITPDALSSWSVVELASSLTTRTLPDGRPVHRDPALAGFGSLDPRDARAIAAYLLEREPELPDDGVAASTADRLGLDGPATGHYLVEIGRCSSCHGPDLAGGVTVSLPSGPSLPSANLTMDPRGVGRMTRDEFIDSIKSLDAPEPVRFKVPEGEANTAMPWPWIAGMSRQDLGAIYDYLATLEPIAKAPPAEEP